MGMIDAALFADGVPIGVLSVPEEHLPRIGAAIRAAGIEARAAHEEQPGVYLYGGACDVDHPRPCEINATLARVQELARHAGADSQAIDRIERDDRYTEPEARDAILATIRTMPPGDDKKEAETWYNLAFEGGASRV